MMRQYELVDRVVSYEPAADEDLLNRAYIYATKKHGDQKRASGDPYFSHPVEVAGILTDLRLDTASIATALLHDTLEDTDATYGELQKLFGAEIAELVDGVTKLSKLEMSSQDTAQAENFRKLLLATANDVRILLVKLADRLHNMRTLQFIKSDDKRQRIAQETLDIFAPLAGRMGMQAFREELEDLSFGEINADARDLLLERLKNLNEQSGDMLNEIAYTFSSLLASRGMKEVFMDGRSDHFPSGGKCNTNPSRWNSFPIFSAIASSRPMKTVAIARSACCIASSDMCPVAIRIIFQRPSSMAINRSTPRLSGRIISAWKFRYAPSRCTRSPKTALRLIGYIKKAMRLRPMFASLNLSPGYRI